MAKKRRSAENVLRLTFATAFTQALGLIVTPILTRLYAPEAFGGLALFSSATALLAVIACLRYEIAIVLPESDEEAANVFAGSIGLAVLIGALALPVLWLGRHSIAAWFNAPELAFYLWLAPLAVVLQGIGLALSYWDTRKRQFGRLASARIFSHAAAAGAKLGCGFAGYATAAPLIGAMILRHVVWSLILGWKACRDDWTLFRRGIRWRWIGDGLRRYWKFPVFSTGSAFLNTLSGQLSVWILAFFFAPAVVGFLALANMVASAPSKLIGTSIQRVFFQRAASARGTAGQLPRIVEAVFERLVSVSLLPAILLMIIGKEAFVLVFGVPWEEAGIYVQLLAPYMLLIFVSSPISGLFSALERQGTGLFFNLLTLVGTGIGLVAGSLTGDPRIALALFSAGGAIARILMLRWLFSSARVPIAWTLWTSGKYLSWCVPGLAVVALVKWGLGAPPVCLVALAALGSVVYYGVLTTKDAEIRRMLRLLLNRLSFGAI